MEEWRISKLLILKNLSDLSRTEEGQKIIFLLIICAVLFGFVVWIKRIRKEGFVSVLKEDSRMFFFHIVLPAGSVMLISSAFLFLIWLVFAKK